MRVLFVHNRYQWAGGEDVVVANEQALLDKNGWRTGLWCVTNDAISGPVGKLGAAFSATYSRSARRELTRRIAEFEPAVVHVHNFFPLLSPSIYDSCRAAGVAVVQTLHNYRTICAGAQLSRDGHPCEDCIGASPYQAVLHKCYRGSRLGSLAVARMVGTHRRRGTWSRKVDRYIALTDFAKRKYVAAGFPSERIAIKPNFSEDRYVAETRRGPRTGALFVGRFSAEKGISVLLRAWAGLDVPLRIVGDGPLRDEVADAARPGIEPLGWLDAEGIETEMARAAFLVMPSQMYENFPMVIAEAFCQGLPVIASRIGALAEIVEDGRTGLFFAPGDAADLAAKVAWAAAHPEAMREMGIAARRAYQDKYTPAVNFRQLQTIYRAALEASRAERAAARNGRGA